MKVEINLPRIERFIREASPSLQSIETDAWADQRNYQSQNGKLALAQFIDARLAVLNHFPQLPIEIWQKKADHTSFGEITFQKLLEMIADHDIEHMQDIIPLIA